MAPWQRVTTDDVDITSTEPWHRLAAHQQHVSAGASLYVAAKSEHTLFDITDGPIDWSDPSWVNRYHRGAMRDMIAWLRSFDEVPGGDLP